MLKGDGLVTYLKAPSVELACQILDSTPLRATGPNMSVTPAKFEMKGQQYQDKKGPGAGGAAAAKASKPKGGGGGRGGRGGGGSKGGRGRGRRGAPGIQEKLERKLGWGGFDDLLPPEKVCGRVSVVSPLPCLPTAAHMSGFRVCSCFCNTVGSVASGGVAHIHHPGVDGLLCVGQDACDVCCAMPCITWTKHQTVLLLAGACCCCCRCR